MGIGLQWSRIKSGTRVSNIVVEEGLFSECVASGPLAAAEDSWMGVSGTKSAEKVFGEAVRGRWFGGILSKNVWEQLKCLREAECNFWVVWPVDYPRRLGSRRGSCSSSGR